MKSLLALTLLCGLVAHTTAKSQQSRIQKFVRDLAEVQQGTGHNCQTAINRWKTAKVVSYSSVAGKGVRFNDTDFPLADYLYWGDFSLGAMAGTRANNIALERAKVKFPKNPILNVIDNTDIRQGGLGDCYFLASASAVAEFPSRLASFFARKTIPAEGIVQVKPYVLGVRKTISLDDYLPFRKTSSGAISSSLSFVQPSPAGELWGPFLEKAFAKLSGNYEVIEGGWMAEAMFFLTDAPSTGYSNSASTNLSDLWARLSDADAKKLIMTAGTAGGGGDTYVNAVGLALSHAYTIIGVATLKNQDGSEKAKLLKMRNPWGVDGQYNGTYGDKDPIWNTAFTSGANYSAQVGFSKNLSDGIFYITLADFAKYYPSYVLTHYRDGFKNSLKTVYGDNGIYKKFKFRIPSTQEGFIGVDFYARRMYRKGCSPSGSAQIQLYKNGNEFIESRTVGGQYGSLAKTNFTAGTYTAYVKASWGINDVKDYSFRLYFASKMSISRTNFANDTLALNEIYKIKLTSAKLNLPSQLAIFSADTSRTFTYRTSGIAQYAVGYWSGAGISNQVYYKVKTTSTTQTCTFSIKLLGPQVMVAPSGGTCTTTYDSATTWYVNVCTCSLKAIGKGTPNGCDFLGQFIGNELKGSGISYYAPTTSSCVAA